jgi:DNA ligase-1
MEAARGPIAKAPILGSLLGQCSPVEAKYIVKIITGELRIGLKEGLVEEAVASAFDCLPEDVRRANLLMGDIGKTAVLATEKRLEHTEMAPFRPVKFMLASPEPTAEAVFERVKESAHKSEKSSAEDAQALSVWVEDKYDGVRAQLHKIGQRVCIYSRDLKDITLTFHDLADSARLLKGDFVLDGEIVAMRADQVLPFSELQKRLGRREGDLFMRQEVPICLVAFDCLWRDGVSLLDRPLKERRAVLETIAPANSLLRVAAVIQVASASEIDAAFDAARLRGNEGLMIKDPGSPYTPGRRGLSWLKLKKALATLDCVVVGAEYGHGKRNKVLSDYTFAVRDEVSGELKVIGKAYSGLTDAEIEQLTGHFLQTAIRRHGRYFEVPPDTVLEIAFDRLQYSDRHSSGLAMRFPRIVRIRTDKTPAEIDTVESARKLVST